MTKPGPYRQLVLRVFRAVWLPLFVLVGVSWLLAPALAHEHYGTLRLISTEEANQLQYGGIFRAGDVIAAAFIALGVWNFGMLRRSRPIGLALLAVAVLSAIDGLFPDVCYGSGEACSVTAAVISAVHDIETVLLAGLVAILSMVDAFRGRRLASVMFVAFQLLLAVIFLASGLTTQAAIVLQYIYEFGVIAWLAWIIGRYAPPGFTGQRQEQWLRRAFGAWALISGMFSLLAAMPHIALVPHFHTMITPYAARLFEQHGIVAGVLLIYLSRHIFRGERPAAWLLLLIFASQVIYYSVLTPQPLLLVLNLVSFTVLLQLRQAFYRHGEVPAVPARLKDAALVLGGVLLALASTLAVITISGHRSDLSHDIRRLSGRPYQELTSRQERLSERNEARLRTALITIGTTTGVVVLWSLFRPRSWSFSPQTSAADRQRLRQLLEQSSDTSEDFFKLWPHDKSYFVDEATGGMVAYRVVSGVAFALADPVAQTRAKRAATLGSFLVYVRKHGWTACFLLVGEPSKALYEAQALKLVSIGSSAVIDIDEYTQQTLKSKWWRWQKNRAARSGWSYAQLTPPHSAAVLQELRQVSDKWLSRQNRQEHGFALGYFDRVYLQECTVHVLRDNTGRMIAFVNELPRFNNVRQASVDLIRFDPAEDGAMPSLLMHVIESLSTGPCRTFDLGFVPLAGIDSNLVRLARLLGSNRFAAAGLEQFKNKFRPTWQANYTAYDGDLLDLGRVLANLERLFAPDDTDSA